MCQKKKPFKGSNRNPNVCMYLRTLSTSKVCHLQLQGCLMESDTAQGSSSLKDRQSSTLPCQNSPPSTSPPALSSTINPIRNRHLNLDLAILNPFLHVLLMLFIVFASHVRIRHNKAPDIQPFANNKRHVLDAVGFAWLFTCLRDAAARY